MVLKRQSKYEKLCAFAKFFRHLFELGYKKPSKSKRSITKRLYGKISIGMKLTVYPVPETEDLQLLPDKNAAQPFLVVVCQDSFTAQHQETLDKLIGALNRNLTQDCNFAKITTKDQLRLNEWIEKTNPTTVLLFGGKPELYLLNINPPNPYTPFPWQKSTVLLTHSIEELDVNPKLKGPLWMALKEWLLG